MPNQESKPTLVFDFWSSPKTRLQAVHRGEAPRESLLGYIQLLERQWRISASDDRWGGPAGSLRQKLRGFLEIPSYRMIRHWMSADVVIIVTRFSPVLAIIAKVLGKKLVFLDAMQQIPTNKWRRAVVRFSLRHSDAVICYSRRQAAQWAEHFGVPPQLFTTVRYCLDADFYRWPVAGCRYAANKPYLISVGRDPERDFATLVEAAELLELNVKLVTLPYLVDQSSMPARQQVSYQ
jgi:glycosyltransferase involved in cell wall biosynthesis